LKFAVPFNQPAIIGNELKYIAKAVELGNLAGDGPFTHACCRLLQEHFGVPQVLLTPSGSAALELAALLCDLKPGDEVIMPSFTFVTTASSVVRAGARPIFVDIRSDTLNLDEQLVEDAVTKQTRALLPVHYGGVSCDMDAILRLADRFGLKVIEDAAQGVNASYKGRALGSIGDMGIFSFHETKNYICGEGGALCINRPELFERALVLWNKGTDKHKHNKGKVRKYRWIDVGASYMPSELASAFLFAQLEKLDEIAERRGKAWNYYYQHLADLEDAGIIRLPRIPDSCSHNQHLFYILLHDEKTRDSLEHVLAQCGIQAISHFEPLHASPMGRKYAADLRLPVTESVASRILRLPLFYAITEEQQARVVDEVRKYLQPTSRRTASSRSI